MNNQYPPQGPQQPYQQQPYQQQPYQQQPYQQQPYQQQPYQQQPYQQQPYQQQPYQQPYQQQPCNYFQRQVGFGEAIQRFFSNYATFSGRASRSEFWWVVLFNFIVSFGINIFGLIVGDTASTVLSALWSLAVIIPTLALAWRRLHDIGKGGGWYFINLILIVGQIIYIVWMCKDSEPYPNRFGNIPNVA